MRMVPTWLAALLASAPPLALGHGRRLSPQSYEGKKIGRNPCECDHWTGASPTATSDIQG